jgi:UDP-N-acetylenolpyruvoylglucosamine reductase
MQGAHQRVRHHTSDYGIIRSVFSKIVRPLQQICKVFNAMIDRRPDLIVRCADASNVVNSVNFARTNDLLVAIRGGGHNVAGTGVCEGGLLIDLSTMKGISVDPERSIARASPACSWASSTAKHRLSAWRRHSASSLTQASPV